MLESFCKSHDVDGRDKAGHDDEKLYQKNISAWRAHFPFPGQPCVKRGEGGCEAAG
jgi:hypothetical protein